MRTAKLLILVVICNLSSTWASVFMPGLQKTSLVEMHRPSYKCASIKDDIFGNRSNSRPMVITKSGPMAMAIPGYGITEQIFVGGLANFLQIYNYVITARVLLSWFPQAQSIGALQPVFAITDPYLNLFRGLIPPVFGLDLSPILAFFTLNVLTSTTASIGHDIPHNVQQKVRKSKFGLAASKGISSLN
eukprot:CAMPEP_0184861290 /NCGR_PEP_ID=MMETSP0580-20130426/6005_1 /TAXON_ID=1118495 /ORGANISM="Dactyliosolen fragilissimus" /LENGTH=188 /DNA_ID=CAMNT_0027358717 /DNA_START=23 /DNA_END=589 /DNA_ORIENTATION=-